MPLLTILNEDIKAAMRAHDKETLKTVRMLKAAIQNEEIKINNNLTKEQEITLLAREAKQRRDSLRQFKTAGREDLVSEVKQELAVVEKYLPAQLTEAEIKKLIKEAKENLTANSKADFGKVISYVLSKTKGQVDGTVVQRLVKEAFN